MTATTGRTPPARSSARRAVAGVVAAAALVACTSDPSPSSSRSTTSATGVPPAPPVTTTPVASTSSSTSQPATPSATDLPVAVSTDPEVSSPDPVACVAGWPIAERVGQVVWPAVYGDELVARTQAFAAWGVGGAVLMTWPEGATAADLAAFKAAGARPLLVATDEEGGDVQRLRLLGPLPSAATVAATLSPAEAEAAIAAHARLVAALGIDVVFAPVVDVTPPGGGGPIGDRSFGDDAGLVAEYGLAYVRAWQQAGILPVVKHFPGHGAASADTHDLAARTAPLDELLVRDLLPFAATAGSGAGVMVGHLDVPGLTDTSGLPASLAPEAYALLRDEIGAADALVFTDALGMNAISAEHPLGAAAAQAVIAGADVVIFGETDRTPEVIEAITAAVAAGRLPASRLDAAVAHVLAAKGIDPCA